MARIKLYEILGIEPKLKCVYGKYPNGQIALTMLESNSQENDIDKCVRYLIQDLYSGENEIEDISPVREQPQNIL